MPSNAVTVATRFPPRDLAAIDALVTAGYYANRADFLRQAARERLGLAQKSLASDLEPFPPNIVQIQKKLKAEGPLWSSEAEMMTDLRKARHEIYREEYGEEP